jgi:hypothetical protein
VLWVSVPSVPVMVIVEVLASVVLAVVTVIVDVLFEIGENEGEAPLGRPVALSVGVPEYPFSGLMVTV